MSPETHPIVDLKDEDLQWMLGRALRNTLILGVLAACAVLAGSNWKNAATLLLGMAISAASILEWRHMVRVINARMDSQKTPAGAGVVFLFFVLRLTVFAGVIYGSLKFLRGSVAALLCGLALAVLAVGWETMRLLRD